jgi:hypothetical protein
MCLRWGLVRVLRVSGGNAVRGLLSWDMCVEWSDAKLGKPLFPRRLQIQNVDSSLQSKIIQQPILKSSSHIHNNHSLQSYFFHLAKQSSGNRPPLLMDAPTLWDTFLRVRTLGRPSSKDSFVSNNTSMKVRVISLGCDGPVRRDIAYLEADLLAFHRILTLDWASLLPYYLCRGRKLSLVRLSHPFKQAPEQAFKAPET